MKQLLMTLMVIAPLGAMARKLEEIRATGIELRSIDLYAALAEVAR